MRRIILGILSVILSGCSGYPKNITPVKNFDINKYLGTWYEIARLDHSFERGLERVTAEYSLGEDGRVVVRNRGYLPVKQLWKEAEGKAYFARESDEGYLKVSFFGPFYAGYNVLMLEGDYEHALIGGQNTDFLWILSRTPMLPEDIKIKFISEAEKMGFDTTRLIG